MSQYERPRPLERSDRVAGFDSGVPSLETWPGAAGSYCIVLAWAELHQAELMENWRRARAGETLLEIEPLQ